MNACNDFAETFAADDGFISWEEFVSYFADGVMGKEELQALFDEIDTHNTQWVTHTHDTWQHVVYTYGIAAVTVSVQ